MEIGKSAPDFELLDQNGATQKLSSNLGKWVLIYFYPKDDTPGCTIEACGLRDNLPKFGNIGATIFGISNDTVESHKKFAEKHQLPFTLLADPEKKVINLYGVGGGFMGGAKRTSFLVNPARRSCKNV